MKGKTHRFYLSLGSNIDPEQNLAVAIRRLSDYGAVLEISGVWESHAIGSEGPDFLNACVSFAAPCRAELLKKSVLETIEGAMGRAKTTDKNAPRTIDIDILMQDDRPLNVERWSHVFVVVPMAELLPDMPHPSSGAPLAKEAIKAAASTWIRRRPGVLKLPDSTS